MKLENAILELNKYGIQHIRNEAYSFYNQFNITDFRVFTYYSEHINPDTKMSFMNFIKAVKKIEQIYKENNYDEYIQEHPWEEEATTENKVILYWLSTITEKEEEIDYQKLYYELTKEELKIKRKSYIEANKEKMREYQKQYRATHKEQSRQYYQDHKEQFAAYEKQKRLMKKESVN